MRCIVQQVNGKRKRDGWQWEENVKYMIYVVRMRVPILSGKRSALRMRPAQRQIREIHDYIISTSKCAALDVSANNLGAAAAAACSVN